MENKETQSLKDYFMKPIDTVLSIDSIIENQDIIAAKILMNEKYGNKYSLIPPHISYAIIPIPEYNFSKAKDEILSYLKAQKSYKIEFSDLKYDERDNIFKIEVLGSDIKKLHEDIYNLMNVYRENFVRSKDLERIENSYYSDKELSYLKEFGYARILDCFKSHITIGNFTVDNVDKDSLEEVLRGMLSNILNKIITVDNVHVVYHTDSIDQGEMQVIWEDKFILN